MKLQGAELKKFDLKKSLLFMFFYQIWKQPDQIT